MVNDKISMRDKMGYLGMSDKDLAVRLKTSDVVVKLIRSGHVLWLKFEEDLTDLILLRFYEIGRKKKV